MKSLFCLLPLCATIAVAADILSFDAANPKTAGMNAQRLAQIPIRMQEYVDAGTTAGIVTVLARHGRIVSFAAVGYADWENKRPMRKDTMFRIASLTKPITCAGIMVLADEGRLALTDPVEKFLPEYKGLRLNPCGKRSGYNCSTITPARPINVEDLMTHTSGLPASADPSGATAQTLAERVEKGAKSELLFEPGTNWNYSNIGFDILGRIIEVVSHQPFDRFLQERIFDPLGMKDTYFFVPAEKQSRIASLYNCSGSGCKPVEAEWGSQHRAKIPSPAGGLVSTAEDILRFNEMIREGGTLEGKRVLSKAATQLMTMSHTGDLKAGWAPGVGHGYGYEVVREPAGMFRYNSLGTFVKGGAYRTYEWVDTEKGLSGVFLMQRTNGAGDTTDEINSFIAMSAAAIEE